MRYCYTESPLGRLLLAGSRDSLQLLAFPTGPCRRDAEPDWIRDSKPFHVVFSQLAAYFAGERFKFRCRLKPRGTDFQLRVWGELQRIPYGHTTSYGEIASRIGNPKASRAVGAAVGSNPLPIIVPCHRVIGKSGQLTGFGGGLPAKKMLLDLEHRIFFA